MMLIQYTFWNLIIVNVGVLTTSSRLSRFCLFVVVRFSLLLPVNQLFDSICTKISSNSTYFLIPSVHQLISESSSELKLKDVLPEVFRAASKQSRGNYLHGTPPVVVELLESTAFVYETWEEIPLAPTLSMGEPLKNGCFCITVPIDTLTLVDWNTLLYNVSNSLKEGICKQLHAIKDAIFWKVVCVWCVHVWCVHVLCVVCVLICYLFVV